MLRVAVAVLPSPIHGYGVFALQAISVGTTVWQFDPRVDFAWLPEHIPNLPADIQSQVRRFGWLDTEWGRVLLSGDDDKFTNHSETPNTGWHVDRIVAVRDIAAGEELTIHYGELGTNDLFEWERWFAGRA